MISQPFSVPASWGPMKPVPASLVGPFERFSGKPVAEMSDAEKLRAGRAFVAASFGGEHAEAQKMKAVM